MAGARILLVEDDRNTRERLADAVRGHPALALVGTASTLAEARAALDAGPPPDVLLTDLGLPDGDGTTLIRECRSRGLRTLSMVITVFGDERHVVRAIEAGALGYLLKDAAADAVGAAIVEMLDGGSPISPPIARHLLRRFRDAPAPTPEPPQEPAPRLSEREREVLSLIVKGFSYAEIARFTGTSPHTVTTHVRSIYRKLEVHSRGEAVYEALQLGLVRIDE